MGIRQGIVMRLPKLEPLIALIAVKAAEMRSEWDACRILIRDVCCEYGWREADELLERYIHSSKVRLWCAATLPADVMGVVVLAESGFPMTHLRDGWPNLEMRGEKPAEIVLLAVGRQYRLRGLISLSYGRSKPTRGTRA